MSLIQESKEVVELIKKGYQLEAEKRMVELRAQIIDLEGGNVELKKEILELRERLDMEESMEFRRPYYMRVTENGEDGPFCPKCYDDERKTMHLENLRQGEWYCNKCQVSYRDSSFSPQGPARNVRDPLDIML